MFLYFPIHQSYIFTCSMLADIYWCFFIRPHILSSPLNSSWLCFTLLCHKDATPSKTRRQGQKSGRNFNIGTHHGNAKQTSHRQHFNRLAISVVHFMVMTMELKQMQLRHIYGILTAKRNFLFDAAFRVALCLHAFSHPLNVGIVSPGDKVTRSSN